MYNAKMDSEQNVPKKIPQERFLSLGLLTVPLIFILFQFTLPFSGRILDSFTWFYADLVRDCGGWCVELTLVGNLILFVHIFIWSLLFSFIFKKIYQKIHKYLRVLYILTVITIFGVTMIIAPILYAITSERLPKTPLTFRCSSVINNSRGNFSLGDALFGGEVGCLYELAVIKKDVSWCNRIGDSVTKSWCYGNLADVTHDISICNSLDDGGKSTCIDEALKKSGELPLETPLKFNIDFTLSGFSDGGLGKANYFSTGDIAKEPQILWTKSGGSWNLGFDQIDPLPVGDSYVLFSSSYTSGDIENYHMALYEKNTGKPVWNKQFPSSWDMNKHTPTIISGIVLYNDNENLYAHSITEGLLLWQKAIKNIQTPVLADNTIVYVLTTPYEERSTIKALYLKTGEELWSKTLIKYPALHNNFILTDSSIYVISPEWQPLSLSQSKIVLYGFDKKTGNESARVEALVEKDSVKIIAGPVFADGKILVRTGGKYGNIIIFDEKEKKVGPILDEPVVWSKIQSQRLYDTGMGLAYNKDYFYYLSNDTQITKRDIKNGKIAWRTDLKEPFDISPIVTPSFVYTASKNYIYALNKESGEIVWKFKLIDSINSSLVAKNGLLYFVSSGRRLNVLQ